MNYTNEQLQHIINSMNSIEYFAENFILVPSKTEVSFENIVLNDYQREVIKDFNEGKPFFKLGARISGKTTIGAIILLHQALFTEGRMSVIAAPKKMNSDEVLRLIGTMYDNLPDFMKTVGIRRRNVSEIEFDNISRIMSVGQNYQSCRGMTISTIFVDESEFLDGLRNFIISIWPCMTAVNYRIVFALSSSMSHDVFREMNLYND